MEMDDPARRADKEIRFTNLYDELSHLIFFCWPVSPEEFERKVKVVNEYCKRIK